MTKRVTYPDPGNAHTRSDFPETEDLLLPDKLFLHLYCCYVDQLYHRRPQSTPILPGCHVDDAMKARFGGREALTARQADGQIGTDTMRENLGSKLGT